MSDATEGIRDDLVYDLARTVYPPADDPRDRMAEVLAPLWPVTMSRNVAHHRDQILAAADALVPVVQAALTEQTQRAEQAEALLRELVDPDDCYYDHHGDCQAHYLDKKPCPVARAKTLLAALDREGT